MRTNINLTAEWNSPAIHTKVMGSDGTTHSLEPISSGFRAAVTDPSGIPVSNTIYKYKFYRNSTGTGTPERTWYYRSSSRGTVTFGRAAYRINNDEFKSDALYTFQSSNTKGGSAMELDYIPYGTIVITNVKAPDGYTCDPKQYYIKQTPGHSWFAEPYDPTKAKTVQRGYITSGRTIFANYDSVKEGEKYPTFTVTSEKTTYYLMMQLVNNTNMAFLTPMHLYPGTYTLDPQFVQYYMDFYQYETGSKYQANGSEFCPAILVEN